MWGGGAHGPTKAKCTFQFKVNPEYCLTLLVAIHTQSSDLSHGIKLREILVKRHTKYYGIYNYCNCVIYIINKQHTNRNFSQHVLAKQHEQATVLLTHINTILKCKLFIKHDKGTDEDTKTW